MIKKPAWLLADSIFKLIWLLVAQIITFGLLSNQQEPNSNREGYSIANRSEIKNHNLIIYKINIDEPTRQADRTTQEGRDHQLAGSQAPLCQGQRDPGRRGQRAKSRLPCHHLWGHPWTVLWPLGTLQKWRRRPQSQLPLSGRFRR